MTLPAMLLAAGFGTRMGDLTKDTPKPLLTAGGTTLLDHSMALVEAADCSPIVVNTHYLAEQIATHLGTRARISHETPEILDSAGGVKAAAPLLEGDAVVTLNADTVWHGPNPIPQLLAAWDEAAMDCLMLLIPVAAARAYTRAGDFFMGENAEPIRRGDASKAPYIYSGAQIIKLSAVADYPDRIFSLNTVWDDLNTATRLKAIIYPGTWVDVGTPEGLIVADETLRAAT